MNNRNRNFRGNRPQRQDPTEFPAPITFKRDGFEFDFMVEDQPAFETFKLNFRNLDAGALKALTANGKVMTADDFRTVMVTGARFNEKLAADGDKEICSACGRENQPVIKPREGKDTVGNFEVSKGSKVASHSEVVAARATETTARLAASAGQPTPKNALATEWCQSCKSIRQRKLQKDYDDGEQVKWPRYLTREAAVQELFEADQKISNSQARYDFIAGWDGRRRAGGGNDKREQTNRTGERVGGGMRGNRGSRVEREQADFYGARLWKTQVEALEKAGISSLQELKGTSMERLIELGVAEYEGQAASLLSIIATVIERQAKQQSVTAAEGQTGFNLGEATGAEQMLSFSGNGEGKKDSGRRRSKKSDGDGESRGKREGRRPAPRSSQTSLNEEE